MHGTWNVQGKMNEVKSELYNPNIDVAEIIETQSKE